MTLLELRNKCELTQKEAADIVKTSLRTYCSYEKDEDTADQLKLQRIKELLEEYADGNVNILKDKVLLITGGTGSFGGAVLKRFIASDLAEIRIFSRDEKKQDDLRHELQVKYPKYASKVKFYIGDVRSLESCKSVMPGVDYIFHAAALKQVPSCEFFPMEAVRTNVIGTDNVLTAAIEAGVKCVICLSTDKAAYPINAMGISKALEEKIAIAKSRNSGNTTKNCITFPERTTNTYFPIESATTPADTCADN